MRLQPRFSLRFLFLSITILCMILAVLGWYLRATRLQRQAVTLLRSQGAEVYYEIEVDEWCYPNVELDETERWPQWMENALGWDALYSVVSVEMLSGRDITESEWAAIEQLKGLKGLHVSGTSFSDEDVSHLSGLQSLEILDASRTSLGDGLTIFLAEHPGMRSLSLQTVPQSEESLSMIGSMDTLEHLEIMVATDGQLKCLSELHKLRSLKLDRSKISGSGLSHLSPSARLESLSLFGTDMENEFMHFVSEHETIAFFDVGHSKITDEAMGEISQLPGLFSLNLSYCKISDEGLMRLIDIQSISVIYAFETEITEEGAERFLSEHAHEGWGPTVRLH